MLERGQNISFYYFYNTVIFSVSIDSEELRTVQYLYSLVHLYRLDIFTFRYKIILSFFRHK
jgi:hypothetical protein